MIPDEDEERFKNVIGLLKQIPKVSTPPNFESDLMRRINSGNFKGSYNLHWWEKILSPSRLIPSAAVAASIIAILYFLNFNSTEQDNPFLTLPKIRENVIQISSKQKVPSMPTDYAQASINSSFKNNKEGLNFLQIRLNDAERAKIIKLKEQIKGYFDK
jgi:hypothetical protein